MPMSLQEILDSPRTRRPAVMGVLNVTPDSFSDGGAFLEAARAADRARAIVAEGADILDVGAESTRPGAERIAADEQWRRLADVLPAAAATGAVVSVDTTRVEVARRALEAGAAIINDVSAGRDEPEILSLAAERGAAIVLMHMLGEPATMQNDPTYEDVVGQVHDFLAERLEAARRAGMPADRCIVDAGIGFGKKLVHNLRLLTHGTRALCDLGCPVLVGPSRKRFIGEISGGDDPRQRLGGTIAACLEARRCGATLFRVHDVGPVRQALQVAAAVDGA